MIDRDEFLAEVQKIMWSSPSNDHAAERILMYLTDELGVTFKLEDTSPEAGADARVTDVFPYGSVVLDVQGDVWQYRERTDELIPADGSLSWRSTYNDKDIGEIDDLPLDRLIRSFGPLKVLYIPA